ncbi:DUF2142 domain-containing protein [Marmoricola sp. RAF53]|uniref:DUF2142 domain-containing protein n=1 Tax=Marmoricola sp. RAF53 TaxID=3233059 RepID=UPI003F985E6B
MTTYAPAVPAGLHPADPADPADPAPARRTTGRRLRITAWATAGFLALQLGWMLSVVPYFGIDEFDHALRASSVAEGHWQATHHLPPKGYGRGDLIRVREDVAHEVQPSCSQRHYTGLYNCYPAADAPGDDVVISSGAARYNPTFYWVEGTLAKPFHGDAAIYAMRGAAAVLCALMFALAVWIFTGLSRTVWPTTAALVAALPTTLYSTSLAAPNGLNMVAGLAVWASLFAIPEERTRRSGYLGLAVSSAVLLNTHTLGILWMTLIMVTFAILTGLRGLLRTLVPRGRLEWAALGLALGAVAFDAFWLLTSGVNDPGQERSSFGGQPWSFVASGAILWPLQAIGAFPMRDESAPLALYAVALTVLAVVLVLAVRRIRLRSRPSAALLFVATTSFLVPAYLTAATFHQIGAAWQGRYQMPFTVGLVVVLAMILDRSPHAFRFALPTATAGVFALALAQVLGQRQVVEQARKLHDLTYATGWSAPSTALLVALGLLAGLCWALAVRTSAGLAASRATAPEPG